MIKLLIVIEAREKEREDFSKGFFRKLLRESGSAKDSPELR